MLTPILRLVAMLQESREAWFKKVVCMPNPKTGLGLLRFVVILRKGQYYLCSIIKQILPTF